MQAIILAGGFGTRLQNIVSDVPKPMAPIGDIPFLNYVLESLYRYKVEKVVLAVGYKSECIIDYFGDDFKGIPLKYSNEDEPLGTGGAIRKALELCDGEYIVVVNGDTLFNIDYQKLYEYSVLSKNDITIALKEMSNFDRYGEVITDDNNKVLAFNEKKMTANGNVNGGIYIIKKILLKEYPKKFSLESDVLECSGNSIDIGALVFRDYFVDIGVPEDYAKAQIELDKIMLIGKEERRE